MVSTSNHCEIDRQRSSTQDLFNAIIYSAGRGRPWIAGTGVCSNSIESATPMAVAQTAYLLQCLGRLSLPPCKWVSTSWQPVPTAACHSNYREKKTNLSTLRVDTGTSCAAGKQATIHCDLYTGQSRTDKATAHLRRPELNWIKHNKVNWRTCDKIAVISVRVTALMRMNRCTSLSRLR